jgi:hypothetical protein
VTTPRATVADTAVHVYTWALLLTLLRVRIADLELLLQMARDAVGAEQDAHQAYRAAHPGKRPEVRCVLA